MIPLGVLASARVEAAGGGASYYDEVMADSPAVYLRLDDASGPPSNDGSETLTVSAASSYPTWAATGIGDGATAADFPGSATVGIDIGDVAAIPTSTSPVTIEALIQLDSLAATNVIWAKSATNGGSGRFEVSTDGVLRYLGGPTWPTSLTGSTAMTTGAVYHVAVVLDGTTGTLYVNGDPDGTGSISPYGGSDSRTNTIGRSLHTGYQYPFDGRIAGFAIHSSALTAARILAHAQAAGVA